MQGKGLISFLVRSNMTQQRIYYTVHASRSNLIDVSSFYAMLQVNICVVVPNIYQWEFKIPLCVSSQQVMKTMGFFPLPECDSFHKEKLTKQD